MVVSCLNKDKDPLTIGAFLLPYMKHNEDDFDNLHLSICYVNAALYAGLLYADSCDVKLPFTMIFSGPSIKVQAATKFNRLPSFRHKIQNQGEIFKTF